MSVKMSRGHPARRPPAAGTPRAASGASARSRTRWETTGGPVSVSPPLGAPSYPGSSARCLIVYRTERVGDSLRTTQPEADLGFMTWLLAPVKEEQRADAC